MADSTRLVLIRHGESRATVDEIVGGHDGCQGLTDRGRRQAETLRDRLVATGELADTAALYASILPRAVETGEIIAPALGHPELVSDCAFCEQHPGEADGMSWAEYTERYREERTGFDPYVADAPGQESWAEFVARVGRSLREVTERHRGETVVVACHGGVVISSMIAMLELPVSRSPWTFTVENTSLTEWVNAGQHWALTRFSDSAHLGCVQLAPQ